MKILPIVCAVMLCGLSLSYADRPNSATGVIIGEDFDVVDLDSALRVCPPDVQTPSPDDARCKAGTPESIQATKQMADYRAPLWSFLHLTNATNAERVLVLEHHLAITERVSLQDMSQPNSPVRWVGEAVSIKDRDYLASLPVFRLVLKPRETKIYRLSIQSAIVTRPGFTLYSQDRYFAERQLGNIVQAFFYGLMLSMVLYNFLLYLRLRSRMYLNYVLFILSLTTMYAGLFGHGFAFVWQDAFTWQKYSHSIAKFMAAFFGIAFFSAVLNVRERMPRLNRAMKSVYATIIINM